MTKLLIEHNLTCSKTSRSRWGLVLLVLLCFAISNRGWAQEPAAQPVPPMSEPRPVTGMESTPMPAPGVPEQVPQDILFLPDTDGHLKPVPVNVTLEKFLEWLDQREDQTESDQAEWLIRSLDCSGGLKTAANGNPWASLTCQLNIEVGQSSRWHSLPLMMGEGLLAGLTDSEEETATSQVMISRDTDSGQWLLWYRNRKSFSVTLELLVPVRVVGDQRQLLLTLPVASRTELQLQIDQQNLMVDLQSRGFWEKEQNENGTLIRIAGFQQNVDLNWSQEREDAEMTPIMHVDSQIELSCSSESTLITARQKINLDRGMLNLLRVKLPDGFQIDDVRSDVPMKYAIEAADPSSITLNFSQPVQSTLQIDWKLSSPIRRYESQVLLEGFSVEGARTQTGKIGILKSHDWRLGQISDRSENVYLMNVRDFPVMGDYSLAFRYYGQPYQLSLNAQRTAVQYTQSTYYQVQATEDTLKLMIDFEISPRNRVIDSIRIDWPDLNKGTWIPEKITRQSTGQTVIWQIDGDDKLLLPLPDLDGQEVIRLEASRKIPAVAGMVAEKKLLPLTLPQISAAESTVQERVLKLCNSHFLPWEIALESQSAEAREADSSQIADWQTRLVYKQNDNAEQRVHWYRLTQPEEPLSLKFEPVERELNARSQVELQQIDLKNQQIEYLQRLRIHVARLPLKKLVLLYQAEAQREETLQGMRFYDAAGNELRPEVTPLLIDPAASASPNPSEEPSTLLYRLEFTPQSPILGDYQLDVQRQVHFDSIDRLDSQEFQLPLLQVAGVDKMQNRFLNNSAYLIELPQAGWQLVEIQQHNAIWQQTSTPPLLEIDVNFQRSRLMDDTGMIESDVQSWLSGEGTLISKIRLKIPLTPPAFILQKLADVELVAVEWQPTTEGLPTASRQLQMLDQATEVTILFPESAIGQPGELLVSLRHAENQLLSSLLRYQLELPAHSLKDNVTLSTWTLNLPQGVYLFSPPPGFNADYQWTWQGLGVRRLPVRSANVAQNFTSGVQHPAYQFSSVGWPAQMDVRLIGRGLLMTLGTGIPILIAVLFAGRSYDYRLRGGLLLVLLCGALALSAPESFIVLLQPALLGTLFTLAATWVATQMRRHQEEPTLIIVGPTIPGESAGSEVVSFSDHGVGADDITRVQPPRPSPFESSHL